LNRCRQRQPRARREAIGVVLRGEATNYDVKGNATPFQWMGRNLDERQWQAFGQDTTSSSFNR